MVRKSNISLLQLESTDTLLDDSIRTPTDAKGKDEDEEQNLVLRLKYEKYSNLRLELHPLPDGLLVSVRPPESPAESINHVPCSIVLVIDISISMNDEAPVPTENPSEKERNGLTVLDLTKHAALTTLETLDENDYLGIVTFSNEANVIQNLLPMTTENKEAGRSLIKGLQVEGMTNLWHGILKGVELFNKHPNLKSASAIMVLTDGQPNLCCPQQGYVPKLRMYDSQTPIHTFGFGYSIRSGLLKSIAEVGGGSYAFIPDASMIGTVFVHAIANLQSTFAISASLEISASEGLKLAETIGEYVRKEYTRMPNQRPKWHQRSQRHQTDTHMTIPLGNIQYGQSRDILLRYENFMPVDQLPPRIHAQLQCQPLDGSLGTISKSCSILDDTYLPQELISYHRSRSMICSFLSTIAPLSVSEEHIPITCSRSLSAKRQELETLIAELRIQNQLNKGLLEDLSGQVRLALTEKYFSRWGHHFLQSIHGAHAKQQCNSFKDPGPLQYGEDSPLFKGCRDRLDYTFDTLPPPKPSITVKDEGGNVKEVLVSMSQYHNKNGNCFAADCRVTLTNGIEAEVSTLRSGMKVWTPKGMREIVAVIATRVQDAEMCRMGELVITPWHPISLDEKWGFPSGVAESTVIYTGSIYSLLLEPDQSDRAHGVKVGGYLAATLGHGVTQAGEGNDKRANAFFGDYEKVLESLEALPIKDGVFWGRLC